MTTSPDPALAARAPDDTVISIAGLTKSWGSNQVFQGLDATIKPGVTGLLGSNGSGKTTLLGMLLGLHHPEAGSLRVLGEDPASAGAELRQHIGYSPEHHDLPPDVLALDLVKHIARIHGLPRREATTRASDALWLVGLGEERARPIGTMSTGQKQRVKLAQAIAHGPELALLDEPTDGLDPVQRDDMLELIHRIGTEYGINVLLSSHLLEEVERVAENVLIISDGIAVASGRIADLGTSDRGGLIVVLDDLQNEVADHIVAAGGQVRVDGRRLFVHPRDDGAEAFDQTCDQVRDAVAATGAQLRRLQPEVQSLEEIFLAEIGGELR